MACGIIDESHYDEKWLIVVPKPIIKSAWVEDNQLFFKQFMLLPLSRNMNLQDYEEMADFNKIRLPFNCNADRAKKALIPYAKGYIINPEAFKSDIDAIKKLGITGLIIDESSIMKNPTTDTTKALLDFGSAVKRVYPMSGKPAPNTPLEYFSQMQIIDESLLGGRFGKFRDRYALRHPQGFGFIIRPEAELEIAQRIAPRCIFISKDECLDLPERTTNIIDVELGKVGKDHYKTMLRELCVMLDDKEISVQNKAASAMKLRQITSGFILNDELDTQGTSLRKVATRLHKDKLRELERLIEEIPDNKQVLIWINFHEEVAMISELIRDKFGEEPLTAYGGTGARKLDENVKTFKEGNARFMIAHPKSIKYGVTFVKCSYAIWFSVSDSFEDFYQANDRIYRKGQKNACTYYLLLCPGTVDRLKFKNLTDKGTSTELIEDIVKSAKEWL